MLLARLLDPVHLAFVGLVEPISFMAIAVFCLGVSTTLEKNVPRLLVTDAPKAYAMMRTGFLVVCVVIALMVIASVLFVEHWAPVLLRKYTFQTETIVLFALPIAVYMFGSILSTNLLVTGSTEDYSKIRIYGNLTANTSALGFYALYPSDVAVFVGLAVGQLPFLAWGLFLQRSWLFEARMYSPLRLIGESRIYYLEGVFNTFRYAGDSLIVSSFLGPVAMAHYFVARTVAGQLNVFFQPLNTVIVHRFGMKLGESQGNLEQDFSRVWGMAPPLYIWFTACYAACIPAIVVLFAGETYSGSQITSVVIAFVFLGVAVLSIGERVLFVMGTSFERFRVTLVDNAMTLTLLGLTMSIATPTTVALAWLGGTIITLIFIRYRAKKIGFTWPTDVPIGKAILVSFPVPLIALSGMNYEGSLDLTYLFIVFLLSIASLFVLILSQSDAEESEVLSLIPERLKVPYRCIRSIRPGSNR